ncbi:MAG TPA: hypothetical protein VF678_04955 [bacterium]
MMFRKDPRKQAILKLAMKQVEKVLRDMQDNGQDLAKLKIKKYQKTHFTNCTCSQCREAERKRNPHLRGILEDGYKVYVGEGDAADGE